MHRLFALLIEQEARLQSPRRMTNASNLKSRSEEDKVTSRESCSPHSGGLITVSDDTSPHGGERSSHVRGSPCRVRGATGIY